MLSIVGKIFPDLGAYADLIGKVKRALRDRPEDGGVGCGFPRDNRIIENNEGAY
jgi:hypothetical protein